jgi:hypothetical protein
MSPVVAIGSIVTAGLAERTYVGLELKPAATSVKTLDIASSEPITARFLFFNFPPNRKSLFIVKILGRQKQCQIWLKNN